MGREIIILVMKKRSPKRLDITKDVGGTTTKGLEKS